MDTFDKRRVEASTSAPERQGPVIYWMSRDQRAEDNWALYRAWQKAIEHGSDLIVSFCLSKQVAGASGRHYKFMLEGLLETAKKLGMLGVRFEFLEGSPGLKVAELADVSGAGLVVTDYSPLKHSIRWRSEAERKLTCKMETIDAHNIVPAHIVSQKREYAAYTIRPKLLAQMSSFLGEAPLIGKLAAESRYEGGVRRIEDSLRGSFGSYTAYLTRPGAAAASERLGLFLEHGIDRYQLSSDPNQKAQSGLSPYLHFGQISTGKLIRESIIKGGTGAEEFVEQAFIRRELAENFCRYCHDYDNAGSFPAWALVSLEKHMEDRRDHNYGYDELVGCTTHDRLWNAAQRQMMDEGAMPGYLRMYWAKKILEWTESPEEAISIAIKLNDAFSLDGRDPNGYAGIAWSIGGVHDRPWQERPVFGMVRYMSYQGMKRKFDVEGYIKMANQANYITTRHHPAS